MCAALIEEAPLPVGWSLGLRAKNPSDMVTRVERGFSVAAMERLRRRLGLSLEDLARLVGTSPRTLARRKESGRLEPAESDRLYRLARLYERAVDVLGEADAAREWFHRPQWALGGNTPLDFARTDPGAREVETLLERIDQGVLA